MVLFWEIFSFGGNPYGRSGYDEVLKQLQNGDLLPFPKGLKNITTWSPEELYKKLSKSCFAAEPNDRASFSDILEILKKYMLPEEINIYGEQNETYQLDLKECRQKN
jgi:hypothetical protein